MVAHFILHTLEVELVSRQCKMGIFVYGDLQPDPLFLCCRATYYYLCLRL